MTNELDEDDLKALRRIDTFVEKLESATSRFDVPEPGSELHDDGLAIAVPGYSGGLVAAAMSTALCGLQGFQALCSGVEKLRRSNTFAYVHRSGLLGACEAYWLLRPADRQERVRRANHATLRALTDEISSKSDIQTMTRIFQDDRKVTDGELIALRELRKSCSEAIGRKPDTLTRMFKEVANDLENDSYFQEQGDDAETLSQIFRSQWRISSADAHGRTWQHKFNDPLTPDNDPDSPTPKRTADVGLIIAKALTVAEIADLARQLWARRMTAAT